MSVLVIGSCVLDVYVEIDKLPGQGEDVNTRDLQFSLGGMAYNVYNVLQLFGVESTLGCAMGQGDRADLVRRMLEKRGCRPIGVIPGLDNGMCLCLVDDTGERSFISHHGAEYRFDPRLFDSRMLEAVDWIYADGLEIEDVDGERLVSFLEQQKKRVFFAPGPRVHCIPPALLERMLALHPVLHINEREAGLLGGSGSLEENLRRIAARTQNTVILTLGERGTLFLEPGGIPQLVPTQAVELVDATGAGDNHAGAILACLSRGQSYADAIRTANVISGFVVRQKGAALTQAHFAQARTILEAQGLWPRQKI